MWGIHIEGGMCEMWRSDEEPIASQVLPQGPVW